MRSANEAIGVGAVVALALLYIAGGMGVGLFFMLRRRWVVWKPAVAWGTLVGALQALALVNGWPLLWMAYDTAQPAATFMALQAALAVGVFIGGSAFFALSFMAAETLTRRAFPSHPQLWRAWGKDAGASTAMAGRTIAGYLLVPVFLAYEVALYLLATRSFGWWTPSDTLVHPDVLATYAPWLTAIAVSLQAGFWEECLFRAVPLAGAALIGDRFGRRGPFLAVALIAQAIVFGAGHAPYPTLPAYARPVELFLPSIGFGLLYLRFGLVPAIVLHYAFDVFWFALPVFLADAPGLWFDRTMIVALTLLPVGVVLWRRVQAGRWIVLDAAARNGAWTPPAPAERTAPAAVRPAHAVGSRAGAAWLALGVAGAVGLVAASVARPAPPGLPLPRDAAADAAKRAVEARGFVVGEGWRVMPLPESGEGAPHRFVAETAGEDRWRELAGRYLPLPRWDVRIATFEGDVAERAEEWSAIVRSSGEVGLVSHRLPESRPGASLDEDAARRLAHAAVTARTGLDPARGEVREISAAPRKLEARTDWTFIYADASIAPLPQGEARITVTIAGDEVTSTGLSIHVPESWERAQRAASIRATVVAILAGLVGTGALFAAAVAAVVAWSRRRFSVLTFAAAAGLMLAVSLAESVNGWPALLAGLSTEQSLGLQVGTLAAVGLVGLTMLAVVVGLALGALPPKLVSARLPARDAARLGVFVGLAAAGASAVIQWIRTPAWARFPDVSPLGNSWPTLAITLGPVTSILILTAIAITLLAWVDRVTLGWTRRRAIGGLALALVGALAAGSPGEGPLWLWIAGAVAAGAAMIVAYVSVLRADLTIIPVAVTVVAAASLAARAADGAFPGAAAGAAAGIVVAAFVGWMTFRLLRRA
jgi:membrane protease YdiL (CAAX protease family)